MKKLIIEVNKSKNQSTFHTTIHIPEDANVHPDSIEMVGPRFSHEFYDDSVILNISLILKEDEIEWKIIEKAQQP